MFDGLFRASESTSSRPLCLADIESAVKAIEERDAAYHRRAVEWGRRMREDPRFRAEMYAFAEVTGIEFQAGWPSVVLSPEMCERIKTRTDELLKGQ